ncbi:MAG TPA: cyclodeaminase/cyclohydrolase family protein [Pseudonocardia sp.]|uniref:cyclodeaminase/cyclohydrolase family protein n=1 Tax=Pseudonocardia sp. TaxID=60912 RepID=UPI002B4B6403|nr:cyclodeaminase/cyclohydrolase family protein [Pseudonocardia sp.]HLU58176.1 cyclodeaminase/cyclohydrolase family protein [Pseudonocardia sp.]
MRNQTIGQYLTALAARVPAPGGGATAALHAAQAAALVAMVARYSDGPEHAEHAAAIGRIRDAADELCENALTLAEDDAAAFTAVTEAYRLPRTDSRRSAAIASALRAAARPPAFVIGIAARVLDLAEELLPIGNPNVISDVAAAAEAARAAATTARVNVEINLAGVGDAQARGELSAAAASVGGLCDRADKITAGVRAELTAERP